MNDPITLAALPDRRPQRADARRNYEKLLTVAREVFAEQGAAATLDEIARRAHVGPATLYRHFPTRSTCSRPSTSEVETLAGQRRAPVGLSRPGTRSRRGSRLPGYAATKRELAQEMLTYVDRDAEVFQACRAALTTTGDALLARAQEAGVARPDASFTDIGRLLGGIAGINGDPEEIQRLFDIVLDGLRYQPPAG